MPSEAPNQADCEENLLFFKEIALPLQKPLIWLFTTLKKDFRHRKADEEKRHEFLEVKSVYEERLHPFVYIDESGFRKDFSRPYGYAPRGQKCTGVSGWGKAQTNVIGALCGTVPFAFTAFDCSIDSDVFGVMDKKVFFSRLTF